MKSIAKYTLHSGPFRGDIEAPNLTAAMQTATKFLGCTNHHIRLCNERGDIVALSRWWARPPTPEEAKTLLCQFGEEGFYAAWEV